MRNKRRAERIPVECLVSVCLFDEEKDTVLAGPVQGEVRDFSPFGLALSLASVRIDNYHLFFTCQDHPSYILTIGFELPDEPEAAIEVPARPVWYDLDREAQAPARRALFGLEFQLSPKDKVIKKLIKKLFSPDKTPSSWWEKLF